MTNELLGLVNTLKQLNKILNIEVAKDDEIEEAFGNIQEYKEDLSNLKKAISKIEVSNLNKYETTELAIASFNRYLGDIIQDLQNIEELIGIVAKRYVTYIEKLEK